MKHGLRCLCLLGVSVTLFSCGILQESKSVNLLSTSGTTSSDCLDQNGHALRAMTAYSVTDACESPKNYVCESTSIGAATADATGVVQECADVSGWGHTCLNVDQTSRLLTSTSRLGSRTVVHCANTAVLKLGSYQFQSSADSLSGALVAVVNKCRSGSL